MIPLPKWVLQHLLSKKCPYCKKARKQENISGLGVILGDNKDKSSNAVIMYTYDCSLCLRSYQEICKHPDNKLITAQELFRDIMLALENSPPIISAKQSSEYNEKIKTADSHKSGISNKEIRNAKKILKESATWDEVMRNFGITEDFIKEVYEKYDDGNISKRE